MKQSILISGILVLAILAVVFQPKLSHAPSATFPPEQKPNIIEQKHKLEVFFGAAFFCGGTEEERLESIIVTAQEGHDGSGLGYYEFRIRTGTEGTMGKIIDGTIDVGGNIHVDSTEEKLNTCKN